MRKQGTRSVKCRRLERRYPSDAGGGGSAAYRMVRKDACRRYRVACCQHTRYEWMLIRRSEEYVAHSEGDTAPGSWFFWPGWRRVAGAWQRHWMTFSSTNSDAYVVISRRHYRKWHRWQFFRFGESKVTTCLIYVRCLRRRFSSQSQECQIFCITDGYNTIIDVEVVCGRVQYHHSTSCQHFV